ncbi:LLM class flavin-dependent oxidoreductase [Clostridium perfringens]
MNNTKNEIKSYIVAKGWKMVDLVEALKEYGINTTPQALSNKLSRDTIRYNEVKIIAKIIGYNLEWRES